MRLHVFYFCNQPIPLTLVIFLILNHSSGGTGPVVGPGALKPSFGDGKESSRLLVHSIGKLSVIFMYVCMVCMYVCVTLYFACMQTHTRSVKVQCLGTIEYIPQYSTSH